MNKEIKHNLTNLLHFEAQKCSQLNYFMLRDWCDYSNSEFLTCISAMFNQSIASAENMDSMKLLATYTKEV